MSIHVRPLERVQISTREKRNGGLEVQIKGADDIEAEMRLCLPAELTGRKEDFNALTPIILQSGDGRIHISTRNIKSERPAIILFDVLIGAQILEIEGEKMPAIVFKMAGSKKFGNFTGDESAFQTIAYIPIAEILAVQKEE